jgi:hypothetical protein
MEKGNVERIVRWAAGVSLGALAAYYVWLIVTRSAEPRAYFEHRRGVVGTWEYPTASVAVSCVLVVAEAMFLWTLLTRPTTALWMRSLLAVGIALPASVMGALVLMHSPPYFGFHVLWIVSVTVFLLVVLLLSASARLVSKFLNGTRRASG